jgi:hypothetical protein
MLHVNMYSFRCNLLLPFLSNTVNFPTKHVLTRLCAWRPRNRGFDTRHGQDILLFSKASTSAPGHIQPPMKWATTFKPRGVNLTTHLHLAPRLRMCAALLPHMRPWREQKTYQYYHYYNVTNIRNCTALHPLKTSKYYTLTEREMLD